MDEIYAIIPVSKLNNAKTRLSPFLSPIERKNLLKSMLKDVVMALKKHVDEVIIISSDTDVLDYGKELRVVTLVEESNSNLNLALEQAMKWAEDKVSKIIIVPSDLPLIAKSDLCRLINQGKSQDFIIAPSRGGGTNILIIKPLTIKMEYGEDSFRKHVKEAIANNLPPLVYDSFFLSLDVNITEDLGEILLHDEDSNTKNYLQTLNISVEPIHGVQRLKVSRK
ncbi:MAG: 2-phospho-L-lactate guanylyltransferase [Methanobrevibacter sp.]|jgi:2-phospho-L-lactate guanylyltransferase|nr:2-phospho-L-lactate guanylyltransferase [Candidatus Methanovirga basalitermitum]